MKMWTPAVAAKPERGDPVWIGADDGTVGIAVWRGRHWEVFCSHAGAGTWIEALHSEQVQFWMPMDWPEFSPEVKR